MRTEQDFLVKRTVRESGSALMLVPAGVLILFLFASLAIDSATVFYAQRELNDAANSLASRISTSAIDLDAYYSSGGTQISIDESTVVRLVQTAQSKWPKSYLSDVILVPEVEGNVVTVTATGIAHNVVLTHLPNGNDRPVRSTVRVALVRHS